MNFLIIWTKNTWLVTQFKVHCDVWHWPYNSRFRPSCDAWLNITSKWYSKFHEALKRSGHTCWSEESCGPNSLTNLYFSVYSLLLGTSDVPVVGCEERYYGTKCAACHAKCAFRGISLVLNEELLGPLESLSDKTKKGRVKRLIIKLVSGSKSKLSS